MNGQDGRGTAARRRASHVARQRKPVAMPLQYGAGGLKTQAVAESSAAADPANATGILKARMAGHATTRYFKA
jgi:hypothetical protein